MRAEPGRPRVRAGSVAATALAAALALTGCSGADPADVAVTPTATGFGGQAPVDGSRNGIETVDGPTALRDVLRAVRSRSVVATGTVTELVPDPAAGNGTAAREGSGDTVPGRTIRFAYRGVPDDSSLRLTVGDVTLDARRRGDEVWVRGNRAFAERTGLDDATTGRVCVAAGSSALRTFAPFTTPEDLLQALLGADADVTLHPGAVTGSGKAARAQVVVASGSSPVGSLEVSAVGQPLPYSLRAADGTGTVSLSFSSWGADLELADPDDVVDDC
ncbi:hypothetical protein GCM10009769_10150 [Curtobacterium luteum]|uniref:Lipoprotein n=1 Tax=Curtobacterium luteum TaxID=33881 RepID=A0A8H9G9I5_9MICO|nr:hypothetical protein [Curtobacterium luteum]GGK94068.1 hypothetical protein GCM10009769_10150 [Curtobacterium luteum]